MKKEEKIFFVQNLTEELKTATSIILLDYSGLGVKKQQELKRRLASVDAKMTVVKNTLFRLAGKSAELPEKLLSDTILSGPTAYVITEADPIAPLHVIYKFSQEFEIPHLKVGIVEGNFQERSHLEILAKLPGKDVLFAQAIGTIASPIYLALSTLKENLEKLLYILKEKSKVGTQN